MSDNQRAMDDIAEKIASGIRMLGALKQGDEAQVRTIVEDDPSRLYVVTHERIQAQEAQLLKSRE